MALVPDHPALLAALIVVLALLAAWQSSLNHYQAMRLWTARRLLFPALDLLFRRVWRPFTRQKGIGEYIGSTLADLDAVDAAMADAGYVPNGLATLKFVTIEGGPIFEMRSWVYYDAPEDGDQTHAYAFEWGGAVHLHQHVEAIITSPGEHDGGDELYPGDPENRLNDALAHLDLDVDGGWMEAVA